MIGAKRAKSGSRSDVAFTPAVKAQQERRGSRHGYARAHATKDWSDRVTPDLAEFIARRESFFFATATAGGQPYIQHRGGPPGFLKVLDDRTLAFADFSGNRQYITVGNLSENPRAHIFLIDYANRRRIKIWGAARSVEDDDALLADLADPAYDAVPERAILFEIDAWDANCPQHIARRYTEAEVAEITAGLTARIAELEAELGGASGS